MHVVGELTLGKKVKGSWQTVHQRRSDDYRSCFRPFTRYPQSVHLLSRQDHRAHASHPILQAHFASDRHARRAGHFYHLRESVSFFARFGASQQLDLPERAHVSGRSSSLCLSSCFPQSPIWRPVQNPLPSRPKVSSSFRSGWIYVCTLFPP